MSERYPPRIRDDEDGDTVVVAAVVDDPEVDGDPTINSQIENPVSDRVDSIAITQAPVYDGPLASLSEEQRTRVGALNMARPLLTDKGLMGSARPPELSDLIRLAQWILDGSDEPLYPYTTGETVVLGPDVVVGGLGDFINWKGNRYVREDEDA